MERLVRTCLFEQSGLDVLESFLVIEDVASVNVVWVQTWEELESFAVICVKEDVDEPIVKTAVSD